MSEPVCSNYTNWVHNDKAVFIMFCSECQKEGKKSIVTIDDSVKTMLSKKYFFDENGTHHIHDPNTIFIRYRCSNGHKWEELIKPLACWCGWPEKEKQ